MKEGAESFESGTAKVIIDEDGEQVFEIHDTGCREAFFQKEIGFNAGVFPLGTKITITEPVPE